MGVGNWGKNHVRTLCELKKEGFLEEVLVSDSSVERADAISKEYECSAISFEQIKNDNIEGVVIATPSPTHYSLAKELMDAGKDLLVEKPLTMSYDQALDLVKKSDEHRRVLMVGHEFRYHPGILALKKMIENNELGKLIMLQAKRFDFRPPRKDMGVLLALAIHDIDLFSFLLDEEPKKLSVQTTKFFSQEIEDHCNLAMEYSSGVTCFAEESWLQPAYGKTREFIAVGTDNTVRVDFLELDRIHVLNTKIYNQGGNIKVENKSPSTINFEKKEPLKEELKNFLHCIKTREKPIADGMVGAKAVKIIENSFKAMETGTNYEIPHG